MVSGFINTYRGESLARLQNAVFDYSTNRPDGSVFERGKGVYRVSIFRSWLDRPAGRMGSLFDSGGLGHASNPLSSQAAESEVRLGRSSHLLAQELFGFRHFCIPLRELLRT